MSNDNAVIPDFGDLSVQDHAEAAFCWILKRLHLIGGFSGGLRRADGSDPSARWVLDFDPKSKRYVIASVTFCEGDSPSFAEHLETIDLSGDGDDDVCYSAVVTIPNLGPCDSSPEEELRTILDGLAHPFFAERR